MSGVRSGNAKAGLTPDTRHLKPMLAEGFITPDNVQKKSYFQSKLPSLKYGFILYLQNNGTFDISAIVTGRIDDYNLPDKPVNYSTRFEIT